ncbi:peptidylprolyl isomerase [Helicobacter sp. 12S02232-10]|uniref:peptidylprolyl isomerase n=1 Tax=Helicobacter sp. 12S02232-10 TaxID=1476197 RepID=UPI000BA522A4|nr:peptidyl-prolyl cis-trans isomerase [Helicobacter sp. 12S02232-10]PAF49797.1 peptidylprolyl isomerase [Helicobacter sp. 12S02232-10]
MKKSIVSLILASTMCVGFAGAKTLATVDGIAITEKDFDMIKQRVPNFNFNDLDKNQQKALVEQAINNILIEKEAKKEKIQNSADFKSAVDAFEKQLLVELWAKKQAEVIGKTKIPDAELKKYYDEHKQDFVQQEAHARHILVKTEEQAKKIISELNKTPKAKVEAKFIELANKESIDPNTKNTQNGGDLGNFQKNRMDPEFAKATFDLKPGTYTKTPIKTQFGYHIIYLIKKNDPVTPTFDQAKRTIEDILKNKEFEERMKNKINELKKSAKINIAS